MTTTTISTGTLKAAIIGMRLQREKLDSAIGELEQFLKAAESLTPDPQPTAPTQATAGTKGKRDMSAAARKRIAAAQKKRWADYHKQQEIASAPVLQPIAEKPKRVLSAKGRRAIIAAAKRRHAKQRELKTMAAGG